MQDSLQKKTVSGLFWTFSQKFSLEIFAFIQGIVLARLLVPSDYGLIAMTQIFFAVSWCFIDSGFTSALTREKKRKDIDYSTVYVTNVCLTFFFASVLFGCSTLIADFYNEPILSDIVRANAVLLVLNSFNAVQGTRMTINLQFKELGIINIICNIPIGIITIILAFMGFGVWSLIYPNFLMPFLRFALYRHYQHWFPGYKFSWRIWRKHFRFGSNLLISSLIDTIWKNLYPIIIGKKFSASQLGYYSKAGSYAYLPSKTLQGMLGQVTFPILCSIQDDDTRLQNVYRRLIRVSCFITFPTLFGLAALAEPFIYLLITEKWAASIPYLQVLCLAAMWYPVHALNLNLLKVKGRSDLFLKLEIIKKGLALIIVFITAPFGVLYMCIGSVVLSFIALFINTYYTGKLINVGFMTQMKDVFPTFIYSLLMGLLIIGITYYIPNMWGKLVVGLIMGTVFYWGISTMMQSDELSYIKFLVKVHVLKKS